MEKTLELIFTKSDGAKKTLSIADPREGLTLAEALIKTVTIDVLA